MIPSHASLPLASIDDVLLRLRFVEIPPTPHVVGVCTCRVCRWVAQGGNASIRR